MQVSELAMDDANATSAEDQESDVGQNKHRQYESKYSMTELLSKYSAQRWKSLPSSSEATTAEESQPLRRSSQSCVNEQPSRDGPPGEEPATCLVSACTVWHY